jgi:hypothetical protein
LDVYICMDEYIIFIYSQCIDSTKKIKEMWG